MKARLRVPDQPPIHRLFCSCRQGSSQQWLDEVLRMSLRHSIGWLSPLFVANYQKHWCGSGLRCQNSPTTTVALRTINSTLRAASVRAASGAQRLPAWAVLAHANAAIGQSFLALLIDRQAALRTPRALREFLKLQCRLLAL